MADEDGKLDEASSSPLEAPNKGLEAGVVGGVESSYKLPSEVPSGEDGMSIRCVSFSASICEIMSSLRA